MIQAAKQLFSSKPIWVRSLVISLLTILTIGGISTLVIKQGLVRWPLKIATAPATAWRAPPK